MDKRLQEYRAKFKPTPDDGEKMLQIKKDFLILFENNNQISQWFMSMVDKLTVDEEKLNTITQMLSETKNNITKATKVNVRTLELYEDFLIALDSFQAEKIELEKRIEGLENHLFRDKDKK